jgi:uncharacterized protein DUF4184
MPFTLSHAAASLPFRRLKPVWPALVIGTFAPDLQYFILLSDEDRGGHYFPEVLLFTLPVALLVLWLFESIVKGPVIELLPSAVQRRLQDRAERLSFSGWRQFALIVFWTVVGITTHLGWDQFTHSYSELAMRWDVLRAIVPLPLGHTINFAHLLQHISTVGGMVVLAVWFVAWYRRTSPAPASGDEFSPQLKIGLPLAMAVIAGLMAYPIAILRLAGHVQPIKPLHLMVTIFEATTLVFCLELFVYSLTLTMSARFRRASAAQAD